MFKDTRENQRSGFSPIFFFLFLLFLFFFPNKKRNKSSEECGCDGGIPCGSLLLPTRVTYPSDEF